MVQLQDLSAGQAAGLVAAAIFALQIILPGLVPLLLLGSLQEHESTITASAATWSLVARNLHSSWWPYVLRADSTAMLGQPKRVRLLSSLTPIAKILLAITAVLTPLGFYESIVRAGSPEPQPFGYVQDTSGLGLGTMPRPDLGPNRFCGGYPFWACPGAKVNVSESEWTEDTIWESYNLSIPQKVREIFSSGRELFGPSVSSIFDIQWRNYDTIITPRLNNGSKYLVGDYRQHATLLLNDKIEAVEGLIVDTRTGGIGFRNHTIPLENLRYGASWSEDILFVIPETQCVDTNLTIDFATDPERKIITKHNPMLTDRGGFTNIDRNYVWWGTKDFGDDTQSNLDLRARAFKGAWLNNGLTMQYMNVTGGALRNASRFQYIDSFLGKPFPIFNPNDTTSPLFDPKAIHSKHGYGYYLPYVDYRDMPSRVKSSIYKNPFNVTRDDFDIASLLCRGQGGGDKANITNIGITCGLIIGIARPSDSPDSLPLSSTSGINWTQPIYSCASAARAVLKTVNFAYNGTGRLADLKIQSIFDKEYKSAQEIPLWVVENVQRNLSDYDPLWGIMSPAYERYANTSALRKESLWLPGYGNLISGSGSPVDTRQNIPGANFHTSAFASIYYMSSKSSNVFDYAGKTDFSVYRKWFELTRNETGNARMLNLIWTDIATNAVVGTRGWASSLNPSNNVKRAEDASNVVLVPIYVHKRATLFDYRYGIPAVVIFVFSLALGVATAPLGLGRRTGFGKLKKYINQTSLGRSMVSLLHPEEFAQDQSRREWIIRGAKKQIILGRERPLAARNVKRHIKDDGAADGLLTGQRPPEM